MNTVVLLCSVSGAISEGAARGPPIAPGSDPEFIEKTNKSCGQVGTLFSIRVTTITVWHSPVGTRLTPVRGFGRCEHGSPLALCGSHLAWWRNALLLRTCGVYNITPERTYKTKSVLLLFQWEEIHRGPNEAYGICHHDLRIPDSRPFRPPIFYVSHYLACGHTTRPFSGANDGFSY